MNKILQSLIAIGILFCGLSVEAAVDYARPLPMVGVPKNATVEQRAAAERLAKAFGATVSALEVNPVCCVWLELRAWRPKPGDEGYIIIHQGGGTLISATSQSQLDAAVERFIQSSREREGKREVPVGLMTSYKIIE